MNLKETIELLFSLPTIWWVLLGSSILGLASGALGTFAVLRKQSLLGDALAHATLPGVCIAFLITQSKSPLVLLTGALISGFIGTSLIMAIRRSSRIKEDAAIGIILSVFFGVGIFLLTLIQHSAAGEQSGLDRFLFGQASSLVTEDVRLMFILASVIFILIFYFYKELKLLSFDREFGETIGYPMIFIEVILTFLIVVAVVIGIQTVGVVLMAALLITPAVAARQWSDRLGVVIILSGIFGMIGGVSGALLSGLSLHLPTGPLIVITVSIIMVLSLFFAPRRGLVKSFIKFSRYKNKVFKENMLKDLHSLGREKKDWNTPRTLKMIAGVRGHKIHTVRRGMNKLFKEGLVLENDLHLWTLMPKGLEEARRIVRSHRLWELYLSKRLDLPTDHVHRDAEDMEHALTPEIIALLEKELEYPKADPHGSPIVQPKDIPDE